MSAAEPRTTSLRGARVLMVSSSYPFHREDFHALFVHQLARALVQHGASVRVLTPSTPEGRSRSDERGDVERWDGVEVARFGYPGLTRLPLTGGEGMVENARAAPLKVLSAPGLMAAFVAATRRAAADFAPDVVITHWLVPSGLALALARLRRPTLHIAHSSDVHLLARLPFGRLISQVIARSGAVLATSEALASRLSSSRLVAGAPVWHLPLELPPLPLPPRTQSSALRVVTMSRLIEGKGLATLIAAVARVPSVNLRIAGAGPLQQRLAQEVAALGLQERVTLVGAVLGEQKAAFLAGADVFAFVPEPRPGSFEDNLPISVLEAMAHGVPVLATRVGNLPQLLSSGGGALVEPDVPSVASALERWATCDRSELERQARETVERFSVERSLSALEQILTSVPQRKASSFHEAGKGSRRA